MISVLIAVVVLSYVLRNVELKLPYFKLDLFVLWRLGLYFDFCWGSARGFSRR